MVNKNGYICNNASLVTATLPVSAAVGDYFRLGGKGAGLFRLAQNSGQFVHWETDTTTTGVTGSLTSLARYNSLEIVCITADTEFLIIGSIGSFTVA